jgi:ATP-dependent DNA helicase DinG
MNQMTIETRISSSSQNALKKAINEASGNEVFAVGSLSEDGKVSDIKITARGNAHSVLALDPYIEKGDVVIHNHLSGNLTPSEPDLRIASRIGDSGIGFFIIDNKVENVYVVSEPVVPAQIRKLDPEKLSETLLPGGELSRIYDDYEERVSQIRMLEFVCKGLNENNIRIAEAGTGVGKSLAYLIPVIKWVSENNERVVISTATINLQQQLMEKDIPLVKRILNLDPKCVLVKGRGNYICRNRLAEARSEISLFEDIHKELTDISAWADASETGSKSDLSFFPSAEVWSRVCSETDLCTGLWCRFREDCFVLRAKRKAASASVLVANHHLLFSDLSFRQQGAGHETTAVLPPFQRVVFDEAHNIEESATSFFSKSFTRFAIAKHTSRFYRRKKDRAFGLLFEMEKKSKEKEKCSFIPGLIDDVLAQADALESGCFVAMQGEHSIYMKNLSGQPSESIINDSLSGLAGTIAKLCKTIEDILDEFDTAEPEPENSFVFEAKHQVTRLKHIASVCNQFRDWEDSKNEIYWIERSRTHRGDSFVRINITPLDISQLMRESLYDQYESIVFTSATLTVNDRFEWWRTRVGLVPEIANTVVQAIFPSPFDFKNNVLLAIPADAPSPDSHDFTDFASQLIGRVMEISGGRSLVLFTSYSMLNAVYDYVFPILEQNGILGLKQGDDDRARLLTRFKEDISSVLFATESFWEGVDTPGNALEVLILAKLPFRVPSDPIVKARVEDIEARGGNSFFDYSLPEAVIKLRQGFGRLMRRQTDKGIVLILDSRIITKSYGKIFLSSLPETALSIKSSDQLCTDIENYIMQMREAL